MKVKCLKPCPLHSEGLINVKIYRHSKTKQNSENQAGGCLQALRSSGIQEDNQEERSRVQPQEGLGYPGHGVDMGSRTQQSWDIISGHHILSRVTTSKSHALQEAWVPHLWPRYDINVWLTASAWSSRMSFVLDSKGVLRNCEVLLHCEGSWGQGRRGAWAGEEVRRSWGRVHRALKGTPGGDWESAAGRSPIIRTRQSQSQARSQGHMLRVAWLQAGSLTSNFQGQRGS